MNLFQEDGRDQSNRLIIMLHWANDVQLQDNNEDIAVKTDVIAVMITLELGEIFLQAVVCLQSQLSVHQR